MLTRAVTDDLTQGLHVRTDEIFACLLLETLFSINSYWITPNLKAFLITLELKVMKQMELWFFFQEYVSG